ncbi:MAG: cell wall hydrolase [Clostridia bacterium]|nr:cell wall hydrolase [Clostridia bacterium]
MQVKRRHLFTKTLAAVMACLLFAAALAVGMSAANAWPRGEITDRVHSHYENIPVSVRGGEASITDCYLIKEITYAPLRSFADAICPGAEVSFDAATRTAYVNADGLWLIVKEGSYYMVANGRYLYADTPAVILDDGRMYVPIRSIAKALGVGIEWIFSSRSIEVTGSYAPILSGDKFYREDEVYWLSRIISAESRGEPLLGQIAVGNVVLNRVKSPDFPNTIWGVIFDRKWGVQFSPVQNGTVYAEPYYLSVVAAKICLEGVTVSDKVLYFLEPSKATSAWIPNNRSFAFKIGSHYFYY